MKKNYQKNTVYCLISESFLQLQQGEGREQYAENFINQIAEEKIYCAWKGMKGIIEVFQEKTT